MLLVLFVLQGVFYFSIRSVQNIWGWMNSSSSSNSNNNKQFVQQNYDLKTNEANRTRRGCIEAVLLFLVLDIRQSISRLNSTKTPWCSFERENEYDALFPVRIWLYTALCVCFRFKHTWTQDVEALMVVMSEIPSCSSWDDKSSNVLCVRRCLVFGKKERHDAMVC